MGGDGRPWHGGRVLVCEDNLLMAEVMAEFVRECGLEPVGPVGQLESAMRMARENALDGASTCVAGRVSRSAQSCRHGAFRSSSSLATRRRQFPSSTGA